MIRRMPERGIVSLCETEPALAVTRAGAMSPGVRRLKPSSKAGAEYCHTTKLDINCFTLQTLCHCFHIFQPAHKREQSKNRYEATVLEGISISTAK